jgi:transmembrane sensor
MSQRKCDREANEWFSLRIGGLLEADQEAELQAWLGSSEENRRAYARYERAWKRVEALQRSGLLDRHSLFELGTDRPAPMGDGSVETPSPPVHGPRPGAATPTRRTVCTALVAASVLGALGTGWYCVRAPHTALARKSPPSTDWQGWVTTRFDRMRRVPLPDGSTLKLNSDTSVRYRQSADMREAILERGEAEFTVVADAHRPFRVISNVLRADVIGTVFSMKQSTLGEIETLVSDGSVILTPDSPTLRPMQLRAGEAIRATESDWEPQARLVKADRRLAWLRDQLDFGRSEPLWRAVEEFNRYNQSQLQIIDRRIRNVAVKGIFDKYDPTGFAETLLNLRIQHRMINMPSNHGKLILLQGEAH